MAILDPLTGLHNRRYMASHLATLFDDASRRGKAVNDKRGVAGVRHEDSPRHARHRSRLPARQRGVRGGHAGLRLGKSLSGRSLRQCIAAAAFEVGGKVGLLQVTASVGVAALEFDDDAPEQMLKRADEALYCAKRDGRNRVVADAA